MTARFYSSRPCVFCGRSFWPDGNPHVYCSLACACLSGLHIRGTDQCWEWTRSVTPPGRYGAFQFQWANYKVHRVMWQITFGEVRDSLCVCHHCDNPPCGNPYHLFLGTTQDNTADMVAKGRASKRKGIEHPGAKLTETAVLKIRASVESQKALAEQYGVDQAMIYRIKARKAWAHI